MTTTQPTPPSEKSRKRAFPLPGLIIAVAVAAFATFLLVTPGEMLEYTGDWFLAKTQMVGYAVCHQIVKHTFIIGRPLPLCARCTGTFIGALIGFFGQAVVLRRRRAVEFPPILVVVILITFTLLWAVDGLNSLLATPGMNTTIVTVLNVRNLYEPLQELRLITGALNGLTMSALVYPAFNATMWRQFLPERAIRGLRDLGLLVLLELCMVGVVLSLVFISWLWMIYPLAFVGALGVLTLLTSVNTMLVLIAVQRENTVDNWCTALIPLLAGFTVSLIQIAAISVVRYGFTRSFLPMSLP
ncbi:MAG: DUF2085 domain-containing protein [Anaerolineae bacterium]|nr:DUF2085 domain-containing protein [Anaerolineae bacterium]